MLRADLLDKLGKIAPALATKSTMSWERLHVLNCVWFTGKTALCYNGHISISVPLKTWFKGAVVGKVLIQLLRKLRAEEVDFIPSDKYLQIRAESTKITLDLMPPSAFRHEQPTPTGRSLRISIDDFAKGIAICMNSVSNDTTDLNRLGVTVIAKDKLLLLFSTNGKSISNAKVKLSGLATFKRVVISGDFCRQFLALTKHDDDGKLEINEKYSLYATPQGTVLYGWNIKVKQPYRYEEVFQDYFPSHMRDQLVPIPSRLKGILKRALLVTDFPHDKTLTTVTVRDGRVSGRVRFVSKSGSRDVEMIDFMNIEGSPTNAAIVLDCKHLMVAIDRFDKMLITDACFVMAKGDMVYLVATENDTFR
jgi:hypothetical protein